MDIVRLDVVSREGATVVDDLILTAASQDEIGAAIGSFHSDVKVGTFEGQSGEPAIEMGGGPPPKSLGPRPAPMRVPQPPKVRAASHGPMWRCS